jgi:hypothetical protein
MNDNTILRIKVPAHLYESVKEQLTINEAKKSGKAFGDWTVVKEKKLPKDGMKKVEETIEETNENMKKKTTRSLDELKAVKEKLEKKIQEMEMSSKDTVEEGDVMSSIIDAIQGNPAEFIQNLKIGLDMSTNELQNFLAGIGAGGAAIGGGIAAALKDKAKKKAAAAANKPVA